MQCAHLVVVHRRLLIRSLRLLLFGGALPTAAALQAATATDYSEENAEAQSNFFGINR